MQVVTLTDEFFAKAAGWEAVKQARGLVAAGRVLSSEWGPPHLRGTVQEGAGTMRCGLEIKGPLDIENLCPCRASRQHGLICAHSVAVGLHHVRSVAPATLVPSGKPGAAKPSAAGPGAGKPMASPAKPKVFNRVRRAEDGLEAELGILLPPNLPDAIGKGKVLVVLEASWSGGRTPLNALPKDQAFRFDAEDERVIAAAEELAGDTPGMVVLGLADFTKLLRAMGGHGGVSLGRGQALEVASEPMRLEIRAALKPDGRIELRLASNLAGATLIPGGEAWVLQGGKIAPLRLPPVCDGILRGAVVIGREAIPRFLGQDWEALNAACAVVADFALDSFELRTLPPRFSLRLAGGLANLTANLWVEYAGKRIAIGGAGASGELWIPDPAKPLAYSTRDFQAEQAALGRLGRAGFTGPHAEGQFQLVGQNQVLGFFAREYPRLQKAWEVTLEERLERSTRENLERVEPQFDVRASGEQWFDMSVSFQSASGEPFSQADIQRLILCGQSHSKLRNGKFALIDTGAVEELQEVIQDCGPRQLGGGFRIHASQAGFLNAAVEEHLEWKMKAPGAWREKAASFKPGALECPPLGALEPVLRPYQKDGAAWLGFLRRNEFGGILADEMGLGKTLQVLAFMQATRLAGAGGKPWLVICPTSLVFNWVEEARKFTPGLKVLALHGPRRQELFGRIPESDLVVTSYALIRRDLESHQAHEYDTVALDEAQHIKNRQTQNAQAVKSVRAGRRLVLTGTPMENSVLDLWSIFDFLMPGYLGSAQDFKERYEVPITKERDPAAQARLSRRIRPFLLRRLKRDVASDLPERIEQVAYCDMTEEQGAVYRQLLEAGRSELLKTAGEAGGKSRMIALNALLRLRQACCDPRLLKLQGKEGLGSGKVDMFRELIDQAVDGGHRVLVFSQFVEMLTLLKGELEEAGLEYCYLDGSTTDRGAVVKTFQGSAIPVFLISLKAGGVGLNLTGADTVIHFDPWWNPAVEAQATDRAHRIGQKRVVTSYKLIARGTVEEKILSLQERKKELIAATVGDESAFAATLSWEEINSLFQE